MRHSTLLAALSAVTAVVAQSQNFTINPALVPDGTKIDWCNAQFNTCGDLCGGTPTANDCSSTTLSFTCTCQNGTAPGLEYYTGTLPTFICQESYRQCIETNVGDKNAQSKCKTTIQDHCGTLDPSKAQVGSGSSGSTSSAAAPSSTATSGAAATNPPSSTSSQGAAPTAFIANGVAAVAAGVFAAALL